MRIKLVHVENVCSTAPGILVTIKLCLLVANTRSEPDKNLVRHNVQTASGKWLPHYHLVLSLTCPELVFCVRRWARSTKETSK